MNAYVVKSHCDFAYCPSFNLRILGHSNHEAKQLQCSAVCSLSVPWHFVLTVQAYSTSFRQPNSCQKQVDNFLLCGVLTHVSCLLYIFNIFALPLGSSTTV